MLREHTKRYCWYPVYDYTLEPWNFGYFRRRIEELKNVAEDELKKREEPTVIQLRIEKALEEIGASEELKELVNLLQEYLWLRTYRTDALRKAYYNCLPFVEEIARRIGWDKSLIPYLTHEELLNLLEGKRLSKEKIEKRKENFLLIMERSSELKIVTGEKIKGILEKELSKEEKEVEILRGIGVYPGKVVGIVKIIENPKQAEKMEKGDILVSTMTSPDMHTIIEKASAIVTDEGGLTCHAAIVSRELKIPCVIATEIATKVLKDGELVEVDSKEGTVGRLKNGHEKN